MPFRRQLRAEGWKTPDTYCNNFAEFSNEPAIYLFLLYETWDYENAFVAYVGMSTQLKTRMSGHSVFSAIDQPGYWPMRWFKPTPKNDLRVKEAALIAETAPPWNIQGRKRGVVLP